jgi:hypothetical protein
MNRAFFKVFLGACALLIFFVVMLLPRLALTASSG